MNTVYCWKCGKPVSGHAQFCSECGTERWSEPHSRNAEVTAAVIATIWAEDYILADCPKCKKTLDPEFAFCPRCGSAAPKAQRRSGPRCSGCGTDLTQGEKYCPSCGAPMTTDRNIDPARSRKQRRWFS